MSVPWSRFAPGLPDLVLRFASACFLSCQFCFLGSQLALCFSTCLPLGHCFLDTHNINLILWSEWYKALLVTGFKRESSLKKLQFLALQLRLSALIWHLTSRPFEWNRRPTHWGDPRLSSSGELAAVMSQMFFAFKLSHYHLFFHRCLLISPSAQRPSARSSRSISETPDPLFFFYSNICGCLPSPGSRMISLFITGGCDTICDSRSTRERHEETAAASIS